VLPVPSLRLRHIGYATPPDSLNGIEAALREAFTTKRPTLIEAHEDSAFVADGQKIPGWRGAGQKGQTP
jgi:hypothetical protein